MTDHKTSSRWTGAAIPAVSALAVSGVLAGLFYVWDAERVTAHYRKTAFSALAEGDGDTARVAAMRLLGKGESQRNDALFLLAQAHLLAGNSAAAGSIWNLIAPDTEPVYAPAHLFLARRLSSAGDPTSQQRAVRHAGFARTLDPQSAEAWLLTGRAAIRQRNWVAARESLEKAAALDPFATFELLPVLRVLGDTKAENEWTRRAHLTFSERIADRPTAENWIGLARVHAEGGVFEKAREILQGSPASAEVEVELEKLYERWARETSDLSSRRRIAREGLKRFPTNSVLGEAAETE